MHRQIARLARGLGQGGVIRDPGRGIGLLGELTLDHQHLELAHHRFRKRQTYNEQLGDATRREIGNGKWERRVHKMIENMRTLVLFDHLYIGGGNAKKLALPLPEDVSTVDNKAGITGGAWLWK